MISYTDLTLFVDEVFSKKHLYASEGNRKITFKIAFNKVQYYVYYKNELKLYTSDAKSAVTFYNKLYFN